MKVEVGQKILEVRFGWRAKDEPNLKDSIVTKVGRKWFYVNNEHEAHHNRYSIETGFADGGNYSPRGRCYESREHYQREIDTTALWLELEKVFRYHSHPKDVDIRDLIVAARALKVDVSAYEDRHCPAGVIPEEVFENADPW